MRREKRKQGKKDLFVVLVLSRSRVPLRGVMERMKEGEFSDAGSAGQKTNNGILLVITPSKTTVGIIRGGGK
jgi:hypothetical protein